MYYIQYVICMCTRVYVVPSSKCIFFFVKKVQIAWFCGFIHQFYFFSLRCMYCDLICGERLMKRRNLQQERNGASYPFDIPDRIHLLSV